MWPACAAGLALLAIAADALAQLSGTAGVVSDYRYRGVSLSGNDPAAQAGVNYDDASGWYAGAFASTARSPIDGRHGAQAIFSGGYATRLTSGLSVEMGADYSVLTAISSYDYAEVFAGFAFRELSGRLYYSPRYFGRDSKAVYAEANFAHPLQDNVRVLAHAGALRADADVHQGYAYRGVTGPQFDAAAGIAVDWQGFNVQLTWVQVNHVGGAYAFDAASRRRGAVLSVSRSF